MLKKTTPSGKHTAWLQSKSTWSCPFSKNLPFAPRAIVCDSTQYLEARINPISSFSVLESCEVQEHVAQDSLCRRICGFTEQRGGFVVEDRRWKTAQKVRYIWDRVVCLDCHTKGVQMRSKKRPSFTFLNLPLAKNLESLEKREKWKERKYQPCGRRHCNPPGKAAWLLGTSSDLCAAYMPWWIFPGYSGLSGSKSLPFGTLHPGPKSWLKIAGELFGKGLGAQLFVLCPAQGSLYWGCVQQVLF